MLSALNKVRLQELDHRAILRLVRVRLLSYAFVRLKESGYNLFALAFVSVVADGVNEDHAIFLLLSIFVGF